MLSINLESSFGAAVSATNPLLFPNTSREYSYGVETIALPHPMAYASVPLTA